MASESEVVVVEPSAESIVSVDKVFGSLVRTHKTRLYQFVLRNIGHPDDAEDLVQQAFVEAYKAYERFRGESAVSTWLYGIAMNLVRNYLNRAPHRVRRFESDEVLESEVDESCATPDEQAEANEMMRHLQAALSELPRDLREVLLLVSVDCVCYEEAAAMLSIPVGTVRSRVSRARAQLRLKFANSAIEMPF